MTIMDQRHGWTQRSLLAELIGGSAVILAPVVAMALIGVTLLTGISASFRGFAEEARQETEGLGGVLLAINHAQGAAVGVLRNRTPPRAFASAADVVDARVGRIKLHSAPERAAQRELALRWSAMRIAVQTGRPGDRAGLERFEKRVGPTYAALAELLRIIDGELAEQLVATGDREERLRMWLFGMIPLGVGLVALVVSRLVRRTVRPIQRLHDAASQLSNGDLEHRVEPSGTRELRGLAASFNTMTTALGANRTALEHQANHDPLTGAANRSLLEDRTNHALASCRRDGGRVGMMLLDLDGFKQVNDSMGHAAGDALLRQLAERMREHARGADTVARLGGDEFVLLVESVEEADADATAGLSTVAERLSSALSVPVSIDGVDVVLTGCLGIAVSHVGSTFAQLLRDADAAMYRAKQTGAGTHAFFSANMHIAAGRRLEQIADLRAAVVREEFVLHFQPIIDLDQNRFSAVEALVRWRHPERGMVAPVEFIGLAEETGLIVPIGRWVLQEACRAAVEWDAEAPGHPPLGIGVNLSPRQLADDGLVGDVREALERSGLQPGRLVLEITETALMHDLDSAIAQLTELRAMGVSISMDDFGTGYSSLAYLRTLPLDSIKVARDFVCDIERSPADRALVRGILEFGHGLGLLVVAEGIETPEQHDRVSTMGFDLGQGYLYSRPVDRATLGRQLCAQPATDAHQLVVAGA